MDQYPVMRIRKGVQMMDGIQDAVATLVSAGDAHQVVIRKSRRNLRPVAVIGRQRKHHAFDGFAGKQRIQGELQHGASPQGQVLLG